MPQMYARAIASLVLAAATPSTYADDPQLEAPPKPKKIKRPKVKSAA